MKSPFQRSYDMQIIASQNVDSLLCFSWLLNELSSLTYRLVLLVAFHVVSCLPLILSTNERGMSSASFVQSEICSWNFLGQNSMRSCCVDEAVLLRRMIRVKGSRGSKKESAPTLAPNGVKPPGMLTTKLSLGDNGGADPLTRLNC